MADPPDPHSTPSLYLIVTSFCNLFRCRLIFPGATRQTTDSSEGNNPVTCKRLIQRLAVPAAMAAAMVGGSLVAAPAASAAPGDCPDNYVCIFQHANYEGRWIGNLVGHDRPNVGDYMNDRTTSIINNTNDWIIFFDHANYGGDSEVVRDRSQVPSIRMNDRISSWRKFQFGEHG